MLRLVARTCCKTLRSRYSKASTAEDGLPHPGRAVWGALTRLANASIDAGWAVMQRGCRHQCPGRIDYRVSPPASPVPARAQTETHKYDDNNARSAPA